MPHEKQLAFHKSQASKRGLFGGNQSGKSWAGAVELAWTIGKVHPYRQNYAGSVFARDCCVTFGVLQSTLIPVYQRLLPRKPCVLPDKTFEGGVRRWPGLRGGGWSTAYNRENKMLHLSDGSFIEFKCLRGDQRILMPSGLWKRVDDVVEGDIVVSPTGNTKVVHVFKYNDATVFRVRTFEGRQVVATPNHKHFLNNGSLKTTEELEVGDTLKVYWQESDHVPTGDVSLEKWQLGWLAILIGDGCLRRKDAGFTAVEGGRVLSDLPPLPPGTYINHIGKMDYRVALKKPKVKNNPLVVWVKSLGLWGKKSPEKFVPDVVFLQKPLDIAYFLKHLWNCDGTINYPKRQATYCSASAALAYDVKYLLWSLGIHASLTKFISTCTNTGKKGIAYHTRVSGGSFDRFILAIGGNENFANVPIVNKRVHGKIVSIEQLDNCPVYGLQVDNEEHALIVDGLVTHNSYDQPLDSFAGPPRHIIRMDEEPPIAYYNENQARQVTIGVNMLFTMTPLNYSQWLYAQIYEESLKDPDIDAFKMASRENPYANPNVLEKMEKDISDPIERAARLHGEFTFAEGRVWKEYGDHNLIDPIEIPSDWHRSVIIDPHPEKPTAVNWIAEDFQGRLYNYEEGDFAGDVESICHQIFAKCRGEHIDLWLVDPSSRQSATIRGQGSLVNEFRKYIPYLIEANNRREQGWDAVRKMVKDDPITGPKLFVFKSCPLTDFQMRNYSWKPPTLSGEDRRKPEVVKRNDDHNDCIRYRVMWQRPTGGGFKGWGAIGIYGNG